MRNKANLEGCRAGTPNLPRANCAKQSQTWGRLEHVGKGVIACRGGFAGKWIVRNKPNLPELVRVISACERNGYGNLRRSVGREKQSQFRPTGPCESRSLGGSRARTPNPRRARGAKQTQFPVAGIPPIPLFHHSNPMPIVRNKPNFRATGGHRGSRIRHRMPAAPPSAVGQRGELTIDRGGGAH